MEVEEGGEKEINQRKTPRAYRETWRIKLGHMNAEQKQSFQKYHSAK